MPRGRSLAITALMLALIAGCAVAFARTQALKQDRPPARAVEIPATLSPGREAQRLVVLVRAATTLDAAILDEAGGVVRTIADDEQAGPGRVRLAWDGTDSRGSPVAPGDYRLRIALDRPARSITFPETIQVTVAPRAPR